MRFGSPILLAIAALLLVGTIIVAIARRPAMPRGSVALLLLGSLLLALAAGKPIVHLRQRGELAVLVDLSPSTRTASYRDAAALHKRLEQLIGTTPYHRIDFGDEHSAQTVFPTILPHADAIVLFSDARFTPPDSLPPTYIVVDPNLEHPDDAAVTSLEARGRDVIARVRNGGDEPRQLLIDHQPTTVPSGTQVVTSRSEPDQIGATARFSGPDAWPENDALHIALPSPAELQQWWIAAKSGAALRFAPAWDEPSAPSKRREMAPQDLPDDPARYLSTSVIVLDNVPADAISPTQQQRLSQFVREMGGGLVIVGGDRAFAAGGYDGSAIDSLSPLASSPPRAQRQWIILIDSSGSMASALDDDGTTRFARATAASVQILSHLPSNDIVSIGSFARDLRWWSQAKSVAQTMQSSPVPRDVSPAGPTNLQHVLESLASQLDGSMQTQIIIISDADTTIDDVPALASGLTSKNAKLNLLATADAARSPLPRLAELTGGQVATQLDPRLWSAAATKLARSVAPDRIERAPVTLQADSRDLTLRSRELAQWNRTWLKRDATRLASGSFENQAVPLVASWHVGAGQIAGAAFRAAPDEAEALARLVARPPRDPRFGVSWTSGPQFVVRVDARDGDRYLNGLSLTLDLTNEARDGETSSPVSQVAPGRYELSIPAPRTPMLATLRQENRVIDRFAVAGRYAPEFDAIGNDHSAMQSLASRTGGAVIAPSQIKPIDFAWPQRAVSLASVLSVCGAGLIGVGLILWKLR